MRGCIVSYYKGYIAVPLVALLLFAMLVPPLASATEYRPELRYGNIVAGVDFVDSSMSQDLFHSQTLAATDEEAMAISFAPGPGGKGPAPSIAQASTGTVAATSTGFFQSNFQFCPVTNLGAVPVGVGQFGKPYPVTAARFAGKSLLFPEMVVRGNLLAEGDFDKMVTSGVTLPPQQSTGNAHDSIWGLHYLEANRSATSFSARDKGLPVILSGHTIDFVATPALINNTSIVERLWRNSHQANSLNYLYEGEAAYPVWIAPVKNPLELIDCGVGAEAIKSGLELTRPGKYLTRSFWTL